MPNWTRNALTVIGPKAMVKKFRDTARGEEPIYKDDAVSRLIGRRPPQMLELSFHAIVPVPKGILARAFGQEYILDKKGKPTTRKLTPIDGAVNGYHWQINNWGTKWEAEDTEVEERPSGIVYWYNTAWAPPLEWLRLASKKFPKLRFVNADRDEHYSYETLRVIEFVAGKADKLTVWDATKIGIPESPDHDEEDEE